MYYFQYGRKCPSCSLPRRESFDTKNGHEGRLHLIPSLQALARARSSGSGRVRKREREKKATSLLQPPKSPFRSFRGSKNGAILKSVYASGDTVVSSSSSMNNTLFSTTPSSEGTIKTSPQRYPFLRRNDTCV